MTEYSKYNIIYRLQKWLDSVPGQTFMNYAYSWGAAVVILGALFKLTHLPGANFWLFLGMGTEVLVFLISGFDRPFDKTSEGYNLPIHVGDDEITDEEGKENENDEQYQAPVVQGGGTIIIGGNGGGSIGNNGETTPNTGEQTLPTGDVQVAALQGGAWIGQQQEVTPDMAEAQGNYVEALKELTEMLKKVNEQSMKLTRDSEEMENLNRTLTGICKVYEMQLKGASQQIGTIDQINEQSRKMAQQIEQLNKIYTRMIEAMTVNMRAAAPGIDNGTMNTTNATTENTAL